MLITGITIQSISSQRFLSATETFLPRAPPPLFRSDSQIFISVLSIAETVPFLSTADSRHRPKNRSLDDAHVAPSAGFFYRLFSCLFSFGSGRHRRVSMSQG